MNYFEVAEQIKQEIMAMMSTGKCPELLESFNELHDYCDANMLGQNLWDVGEHSTENYIDSLNEAHTIVDRWLKARQGILESADHINAHNPWYNPILSEN